MVYHKLDFQVGLSLQLGFISDDDEEQIATCIHEFQAAGFPLTVPRVRSLAWQYADVNGIPAFSDID